MIRPGKRFDSSVTTPSPYPADGHVDKEKRQKRQNRQVDLGDFGVSRGEPGCVSAGSTRGANAIPLVELLLHLELRIDHVVFALGSPLAIAGRA